MGRNGPGLECFGAWSRPVELDIPYNPVWWTRAAVSECLLQRTEDIEFPPEWINMERWVPQYFQLTEDGRLSSEQVAQLVTVVAEARANQLRERYRLALGEFEELVEHARIRADGGE